MSEEPVSRCSGCGLGVDDPFPVPAPGGVAAAECSRRFGELLAASYQNPERRPVHQLVVDAYVVQHGGGTGRREVQAVALCLMTLGLFLDEGEDPRTGPVLHRRMADSGVVFSRLQPPRFDGSSTTVADVLAADDEHYVPVLRRWAQEVWTAWEPHHAIVRSWIAASAHRVIHRYS